MKPGAVSVSAADQILTTVSSHLGAGNGGRDAFHAEALAHLNVLHRVALSKTRNRQDAADLVQDTFLRALQFQHRFQPGSNCRAWLLTIMHSLFVNRLRQSCHVLVGFDEQQVFWEAELPDGATNNPEVSTLRRLAREDIQRAIGLLPPKFRAVVVLADVEGCSYREIAEICGCPIGTVMSRLYRGRQALRGVLRELGTG